MKTRGKHQHSARFYLSTYAGNKSKERILICHLHVNNWTDDYKPITFSTDINIHPDFWNKKENKGTGTYDFINSKIERLKAVIKFCFENHPIEFPFVPYLKEAVVNKWNEEKDKVDATGKTKFDFRQSTSIDVTTTTFYEYIVKRTEKLEGMVNTSGYKGLAKELKKFHDEQKIEHVMLSEISHEYFIAVMTYLKENRNWSVGYWGNYIKNIKKFYHDARDTDKLPVPNITFKEDKTSGKNSVLKKVKSEDSKDVACHSSQLKKVIELEFAPHETELSNARDWFVVGSLTGGLRVSDLKRLKDIHNGIDEDGEPYRYIQSWSQKTGAFMQMPLYDVVEDILRKHNYQMPTLTNDLEFSKCLQTVAKRAGLKNKITVRKQDLKTGKITETTQEMWELVRSSTMRKTFCTYWFREKKKDAYWVMAFSAHKNLTSFEHYIADTGDNSEFAEMVKMVKKDTTFKTPQSKLKVVRK